MSLFAKLDSSSLYKIAKIIHSCKTIPQIQNVEEWLYRLNLKISIPELEEIPLDSLKQVAKLQRSFLETKAHG